MAIPWRETLETLRTQFQARAAHPGGIYHLMVEVANDERDRMQGPDWFKPHSDVQIVDGKINYRTWDCSRITGLPGVTPGFREPFPNESFTEEDRVVRDKSGVVRAVLTPRKLRRSYFCGSSSEEIAKFEALANIAAIALAGADDLSEHFFANEMLDIFRQPRGEIRYIFGEVPGVPNSFISQGWNAGILQFDNGVLIDLPIAESTPDSSHWVYLLHRLGWHRAKGSGLTAHRMTWKENMEIAWDMLELDWSAYPDEFSRQFDGFSRTSFYSVLGTKESPLDINFASALAIQLLLANLETKSPPTSLQTSTFVDYSKEPWKQKALPSFQSVTKGEADRIQKPIVGIVVATEVERQAVLRHLSPPTDRTAVLQVFNGNNTYFVGRLGATDVVVVMTSSMGSIGRDSSAIVTTELLDLWGVPAVIMVGIAFGKDSEKQMIGGVLISEKIISYEPERLGVNVNQERGDSPRAGALLLNRFKNLLGWTFTNPAGVQCSHQIGPILSGEKLLDNPTEKATLFQRFPSAIGGEMEGAGFSSSAERKKCEWIVVKAICDWGNGNKDNDHQEFAATASISLVEHVLNQSGVLHGLNLSPSASAQSIKETLDVHIPSMSSTRDTNTPRPIDIKRFQSNIAGQWFLRFEEGGKELLEMDDSGNYFLVKNRAVREIHPKYRIVISELDFNNGRVVWNKVDAETGMIRQSEELQFEPTSRINELFGNRQGDPDHLLIYKRGS